MKNFIYFFKHKNINAIKIGKTCGDDVLSRFNTFKTYSPFGAEIVGYFECEDCHHTERELHQRFKEFRLNGEFYDISTEQIQTEINKYNNNSESLKSLLIEFLSDDKNDIEKLSALIKQCLTKETLLFGEKPLTGLSKRVYEVAPNKFTIKQVCELTKNSNITPNAVKTIIRRCTPKYYELVERGIYKKVQ